MHSKIRKTVKLLSEVSILNVVTHLGSIANPYSKDSCLAGKRTEKKRLTLACVGLILAER